MFGWLDGPNTHAGRPPPAPPALQFLFTLEGWVEDAEEQD